ncbi:MAG: hypothetical protein V1821_03155, partial [bacterium]
MAINKTCRGCQKGLELPDEDLAFYERIKFDPPNYCPDCRFRQRVVWRNERTLYRRECSLCHKNLVSIYHAETEFPVYCNECYHSDKWNQHEFAMEVDFSKPFLAQVAELQKKMPRQYAFVFDNVNSEYTNGSAYNKNCYLLFVSDHNEDSLYSYSVYDNKNSLDALNCNKCELSYEIVTCKQCYRTYFSEDCSNSENLYYCKNCWNCQDCIGCVNLRGQKYHIFN